MDAAFGVLQNQRNTTSTYKTVFALLVVACVTALTVAVHFKEPVLFVYIILGFGSVFALLQFGRLWIESTRRARQQQRLERGLQQRFERGRASELTIDEISALIERGDLIMAGFQSAARGLRPHREASAGHTRRASPRDLALLPSYRFEEAPSSVAISSPAADPALAGDDALSTAQCQSSHSAQPIAQDAISLEASSTAKSDPPTAALSCAICLERYVSGDIVSLLPCFHGFHEGCLSQWLGIKAACPICKSSLKKLLHDSLLQGQTV